MISAELRQFVRTRAGNVCEYCGLRQDQSLLSKLQIEHVVPSKHRGSDEADYLALACMACNLHKGSDLVGRIPETGELVPLYNPRLQRWDEHFAWTGVEIVGLTAVGKITVQVLQLNSDDRLRIRLATLD